jgi:hypothetical protein
MGWLGVMSAAPCLFEPFGQSPDDDELRECQRKLFTKHHIRVREARKNKGAKPVLPRQWAIVPSLPPRIAKTFALRRSRGWPRGIFLGPDGCGLGWVSLRDLPRTRQTLLLRLMGGMGPVFRNAIEDLENLPQDAWEKEQAKEMLVARREDFGQNPSALDQGEQEFLMTTQELYQQWERRVQQEGRNSARQEVGGRLCQALLETYRARFGAVPPAVANAVQLVRDPDTLASWVPLFSTKSVDEIAEILGARNGSA